MTGTDFLLVARALAKEKTEAAWRSSVSRAYYAAFHVARHLMRDLGFVVPRSEQAHTYLERRLSNSGEPQVEFAGARLGSLRTNRHQADYDLHRPALPQLALSSCNTADQIIQFLGSAAVEPTRTQIKDTMKVYERDVLQAVTWRP
jgi:uncharacterized protein (UPF0332 family)